jgi:hypothetical protein
VRNYGCPTPRKEGYRTRKDARRWLREARHRMEPLSYGYGLGVYRCDCGLFHLGNRMAETRADERAALKVVRAGGTVQA